jgi:chromosomal replication initiation ATPase DnaA
LVEKDDILVSRKRGKVSEARRMCFALMKRNLEITDGSIGDYVGGRSKQFVHNELKNITLDEKKFETKKQLGFYKDFIKLNDELLIVRNSNYKKTSK